VRRGLLRVRMMAPISVKSIMISTKNTTNLSASRKLHHWFCSHLLFLNKKWRRCRGKVLLLLQHLTRVVRQCGAAAALRRRIVAAFKCRF
jgi:hypothetical protein